MDREPLVVTELINRPIPIELPPLVGWKEVGIKENNEPLVPLGIFSENDQVFTHSIYFGEKKDSPYPADTLEGSLITMFVRKEVAEQLKKAQSLLPQGMHLIVFDAYRTLKVQKSLYDVYYNELQRQNPDWNTEQLSDETQKYVSIPSNDFSRPSPHNTGGSIDLAIFQLPKEKEAQAQEINDQLFGLEDVDWEKAYQLEMRKLALIESNMQLLDFGTQFDHGGKEAALNYYEKLALERPLTSQEQLAQRNRRTLYNIMTDAGFEPYEEEWWHFNSTKSQMGAKVAGLDYARYGPMELSPDNSKHEMMRRMHWLGSKRIFASRLFNLRLGLIYPNTPEMRAAWVGVREVGFIGDTKSPSAAIIKPGPKAA